MRGCRLLSALLMAGTVIASPAFAAHHHHAAKVAVNNPQNCSQNVNMPNTSANCANTNVNCAAAASNHANCAVQNTNPNTNPTLASADSLLQQSSATVNQLQSDNNAVSLMRSAKGVFIIPSSTANAAGGAQYSGVQNAAGAQAGGVLLSNNNGRWSNPVFFSIGGAATGNQAAANNNNQQVALFIMSNRAMNEFRGGTASLNTKKLHIVNYAPGSQQAPPANTDVVVWSGNNNAPNANVLSGISMIRSNTAFDHAVYGTRNMQQIIAGRAPLTNQLAVNLSNQTPAPQASTQVGTRETTTRPG